MGAVGGCKETSAYIKQHKCNIRVEASKGSEFREDEFIAMEYGCVYYCMYIHAACMDIHAKTVNFATQLSQPAVFNMVERFISVAFYSLPQNHRCLRGSMVGKSILFTYHPRELRKTASLSQHREASSDRNRCFVVQADGVHFSILL